MTANTIGTYHIVAKLGEGGMGEVYHARDPKLNRGVAIKVLLAAVGNDPERLARFSREAQVLASLNHPNIAHIHGLEQSDAGPFLVMELVEGPTLADRISQGPLPLDEALAIARQIADALEAAHDQGIVHRDLKPANVKVRDDGTVKVLDFGLAKAIQGAGGAVPDAAANSPTITTPAMMTSTGIILGTAAYMSPEQAKGRAVDRRTDVWAFACVLYEMLAGRRAFDGEDVTDTIAAVVRGEPDWAALPPHTPSHIRLLLRRCLDKDRRTRVADISVARFLITEPIESTAAAAAVSMPPPAAARRRAIITAAVGAIAGGFAAAAMTWAIVGSKTAAPNQPVRFNFVPPAAHPLATTGSDNDLAISPDGSHLVYRSGAGPAVQAELVLRPMNDVAVQPVVGTTGARNPFFSPDGRWIGFFVRGELQKVSITGGPTITLCKVDGSPRGASWGDDDAIVFATVAGRLLRVPASGGDPTALTSPDTAHGEAHYFPYVLPGARAVIFTTRTSTVTESSRIDVLDVRTGQARTLVPRGHDAVYADSGHLVFAVGTDSDVARNGGSLRAVGFDLKRLEVTSDPAPAIAQVAVSVGTGAAEFALSRHGDLVYVPSDSRVLPLARPRSLVWVDRKGKEEPLAAPERPYAVARISPDGTRVALDVRDQTQDIWIWDLKRETLTPLNRDPAQDMSPVWTPDGRRIIFTSTRAGGNPNLYWQAADGTGSAERLTTTAGNQFPTSISPDASQVLIFGAAQTGVSLFSIALQNRDRKAQPLLQATASYFGGEISPDGRWLAYHSTESAEPQVYVRPFPNVDGGRWQISTGGGTRAVWARSGRELFYLDEKAFLTSVRVTATGDTFSAETPARILSRQYYVGASVLGLDLRAYDVTADGQRFLMIKDSASSAQTSNEAPASIVVVMNWNEELKSRLPAK